MSVLWGCQASPAPETSDAALTFPDAITADIFDPAAICATDNDCEASPDCCLEVACVDARCEYDVLAECCTALGPCAAAAPYHSGVCVALCQEGGCESRLRLPENDCGDTVATLLPNERAPAVSVDRRGMTEGLGWHFDLRMPYALSPTWRLADARCGVLHNGPLSGTCEPVTQDSEAFYAALSFGPVALPTGRPLVLEAVIAGGTSLGPDDSGHPEIALEVLFANGAAAIVWRSGVEGGVPGGSADAPLRWRAIGADLTVYGGLEVSLRFTVTGVAGPPRRDPGVGLGELRVRAPCASERLATEPAQCESSVAVAVQGTGETLYRTLAPDPDLSCIQCDDRGGCPTDRPCLVYECRAGFCAAADLESACCESGPAPSPEWTDTVGLWASSGLPWLARLGPDGGDLVPFHFPLAGQPGIPRGDVVSPTFFIPPGDATLAFDLWLETEWDDAGTSPSSSAVDVLRVDLLSPREGEPLATQLWNSAFIGGSTRGAWRRVVVPVHAAAGSAGAISLSFDAGDPDFNEYGGAWIRRLSIGANCDMDPAEP